jgi:ubiquinone/menaquinone biosynthesis C-methylase UbiE
MEAHRHIARRLDMAPELVPLLAEVFLDLTVVNPVLPDTPNKLGRSLDLRPGNKVLDLGCGKAGMSLPLVHTYKVELTGVDLMAEFIREAWARAEYSGLYPNCRFILGDAARFVQEAPEKNWDAVIIVGALPFIWDDMGGGLKSAARLIRSGGRLVVGEGYRLPQAEHDPETPFTSKEDTSELLAEVGEVVDVIDDGRAGWDHYVEGQAKSIQRLRETSPDNEALRAFLDQWEKRNEWERNNLGFALWVLKVD